MSLDFDIITNVVREGKPALQILRNKGIKDEFFEDRTALSILNYIREFVADYGETPIEKTVIKKFGKVLTEPDQGLLYNIEQMTKRHQFKIIATSANKITEMLNADDEDVLKDVDRASKLMIDGAKRLIIETSQSSTSDVTKDTQLRWQRYLEREAVQGITGIPTPWPFMTNMTRGFQPGQTYMFLAQEGTGKTFLLMLLSQAAYRAGFKPIFFTEEMSAEELGNRFDALYGSINYDALLKGGLNPDEKQKFQEYLEKLERERMPFYINESGGAAGLDNILELSAQVGADIIFIDNIYLYADELDAKHLAKLSGNLKKGASRLRVPIVFTTQINEGGGSFWSKSFGHDVSYRFVVEMPDGQEYKRVIRSTKQRDSASAIAVVNWNPKKPDYSPDDDMTELFSGGAANTSIEGAV